MPDFDGRGFRLHYEDRGEGEAVVLLHGYLMDHHLFDSQVGRFSARYRCIAPDRRGHGESDCPAGSWSMADLVEDVVALTEALDAHPCHLVGMSIRRGPKPGWPSANATIRSSTNGDSCWGMRGRRRSRGRRIPSP